jgi:hypothetical protein
MPLWPCMQDCLNGLGLLLRLELRGYRDEVQARLEPIAERLENEVSFEASAVLFSALKAARSLVPTLHQPVGGESESWLFSFTSNA